MIWLTASQKHFEWFIDILRQVEEVDTKGVLETHIFITQLFESFDLRTTMLVSSIYFNNIYMFDKKFSWCTARTILYTNTFIDLPTMLTG